jgi:hypothetical protein
MSSNTGRSKHFSNLISGVIAAVTPMLGMFYFCSLVLLYRNAQRHPRTFKNKTGLRLQRYGPGRHTSCVFTVSSFNDHPAFYAFLVCSSLAEVRGCFCRLLNDMNQLHAADWSGELAHASVPSQ